MQGKMASAVSPLSDGRRHHFLPLPDELKLWQQEDAPQHPSRLGSGRAATSDSTAGSAGVAGRQSRRRKTSSTRSWLRGRFVARLAAPCSSNRRADCRWPSQWLPAWSGSRGGTVRFARGSADPGTHQQVAGDERGADILDRATSLAERAVDGATGNAIEVWRLRQASCRQPVIGSGSEGTLDVRRCGSTASCCRR